MKKYIGIKLKSHLIQAKDSLKKKKNQPKNLLHVLLPWCNVSNNSYTKKITFLSF